MEDVEILHPLAHPVEHDHVIGDVIAHPRIEPQRFRRAAHEFGRRDGIAAGEKGHVVAEPHELFRQIGNDALGTTVQARGDTLH